MKEPIKDPKECSNPENLLKYDYYIPPNWRSRYPSEERIPPLNSPDFAGAKLRSFDEKILVGEKSPNYFVETQVPKRIREYNPNAKIIILVCEPGARVLSDFAHFQRQLAKNTPHQMMNLAGSASFKKQNNQSFENFVDEVTAKNFENVLTKLGNIEEEMIEIIAKKWDEKWKNEPPTSSWLRGTFKTFASEDIEKYVDDLIKNEIFPHYIMIATGFYEHYLQNWYNEFGKENVLVR